MSDRDIVRWAAKHAAEQPFLLAFDLRQYQELTGASERDLASALECSSDALACLALCRRPDPSGPSFRAAVEKIASHCGVNAHKLAALLREIDSVGTIRDMPLPDQVAPTQPGLLAAARDRKHKPRRARRGKKRS